MKPMLQKRISQVNREAGRNFAFFRKYYFKHYHKVSDAPFHVELVTLLSEASKKRGAKIAIAAPRGSAKSTVITLEYVLYSICNKLEPFILIISSTSGQAEDFLNSIKKELESNQELIEDFPDICEIGKKPGPERWRKNEIITRNGIKVLALSPGQQIRGRRNKEIRPSLIILDDVETDEMQSLEQYDKLLNWFTKSLLKAGSAETNLILAGTIHHYNSLLALYVHPKQHPGWIKRIYRSVISWSSRSELWEKWSKIYNNFEPFGGGEGPNAAERFFEMNRGAMLENTQVLWPEYKDYYALMVMREEDGAISFDSEMQNEPVNPKECYFNPEEMHYWDDEYSSEEELLANLGLRAEIYGACDPSLGKSGLRGDFSAIITIAKDCASKTLYVLDADIDRRKPDQTIHAILMHCRRRNCKQFAFETNHFQALMKDQLEKAGREKGISPAVKEVNHTSDKLMRIQSLQPLVKNGTIRFSKKHRALLEQLKCFPKGNYDDGPDALEMAVDLSRQSDGSVMATLDRDVRPDYEDRFYRYPLPIRRSI
ncbi:MAG: phage terminase large subunit [Candidatus Omnitrophica bacterium]|nr:phage terminase large subunit [Candidatus Omnitrophota bacterium]